MKNIFIFSILAAMFLTACGKSSDEPTVSQADLIGTWYRCDTNHKMNIIRFTQDSLIQPDLTMTYRTDGKKLVLSAWSILKNDWLTDSTNYAVAGNTLTLENYFYGIDGEKSEFYTLPNAVFSKFDTSRTIRNQAYLGDWVEVIPEGVDTLSEAWEREYKNLRLHCTITADSIIFTHGTGISYGFHAGVSRDNLGGYPSVYYRLLSDTAMYFKQCWNGNREALDCIYFDEHGHLIIGGMLEMYVDTWPVQYNELKLERR